MGKLLRMVELISVPGALHGALTWKKFSLAAYLILLRLKEAGINPATVLDVGANVGQFSVAVSHLFPNAALYPVEPDPHTAERLRRNLPRSPPTSPFQRWASAWARLSFKSMRILKSVQYCRWATGVNRPFRKAMFNARWSCL